jgi:hypothetical protein
MERHGISLPRVTISQEIRRGHKRIPADIAMSRPGNEVLRLGYSPAVSNAERASSDQLAFLTAGKAQEPSMIEGLFSFGQ